MSPIRPGIQLMAKRMLCEVSGELTLEEPWMEKYGMEED